MGLFSSKYPKKLDRKPFLNYIYLFVTNVGEDYEPLYPIETITNVEVEEHKDKIVLSIITPRPGFVIGRGGKNIDGLRNFLNLHNTSSKAIHINLVEDTLWSKCYGRLNEYPFNK